MMKEHDIVCLSFPAWDGNYVKSTVKLMCALTESNRVLFVDYAYTWKDVIKGIWGSHKHIPWQRILGLKDRIRYVILPNSSICVLSLPPMLPYNWARSYHLASAVVKFNAFWIKRSVRKALKKLHMEEHLVINALNPVYGIPLAGKLNERLLIYYCYDEISAAKWISRHGKIAEEKYLPTVDVAITSSEQLKQKKKVYQPYCYRVPNGVDLSLFEPKPAVDQALRYKKNTVGYLGSVDDRLDLELLSSLCKQMPELEFQFLGRITSIKVMNSLKRFPNVKLLGPKPPEELSDYLHQWEVGIIPFVKNEFTAGIYPMKINEYLATGLPVVSTRFGDMDDFEEVACICDDIPAFLEAVVTEMMDNDADKVQRRLEFARANTWKSRAKDLVKILNEHIYGASNLIMR